MKSLLRSNKNQKKSIEGGDEVSKTRNNRVNFSSEFIRVNKNELNYSALSNQIKHIFVFSLKQCYDLHIMKNLFYRWQDENELSSHPIKLYLTNEDATQLVWRMQKIILNHKAVEKSINLQMYLQELQKQRDSYRNSHKDMQQKQDQLNSFVLGENGRLRSKDLVEKITQFKSCLVQKLQSINQEIQNKSQELKQTEKELQFSKEPTARLSKYLTKIIIKEVRSLLKQTIIGILQISNQIIKQGQVDNQQVYVIFEQTYKTIKIKKTTIVKYLGSDFYLEKVNYFGVLMKARMQMGEKELKNNNFVCCHRCMKICKLQKMKFCDIQVGQTQVKPYPSTDYLNYRKNYLEGDFFYESIDDHIIPFHHYNKNSKGQLTCNRGFCEECVKHHIDQPFACPYCSGVCSCPRCQKAEAIVKLKALDYQNDPEGIKPYHELSKLFGGKEHKDILQFLKLRQPNSLEEFQLMRQIFVEFNNKYSTSEPQINILNVGKQSNFKVSHQEKNKTIKVKLNRLQERQELIQSRPKQKKVAVEISAISKNQDGYLNQLLKPLFTNKQYSAKDSFQI